MSRTFRVELIKAVESKIHGSCKAHYINDEGLLVEIIVEHTTRYKCIIPASYETLDTLSAEPYANIILKNYRKEIIKKYFK